MKKLVLFAMFLLFAGCAHAYGTAGGYNAQDYRYHKHTLYLVAHWNLIRPDKDTVVAEGFVEPFNPSTRLRVVMLDLVGLDEQGVVVNWADGLPRDVYIESPFYPASPFRIMMHLNGRERYFTITGSYYHSEGERGARSELFDYIPITSY